MPHSTDIRIVLTTFPNEETAAGVIRDLLRGHLITCGTMLPGCRSIYAWNGQMQDSDEVQTVLKTTLSCMPELERQLVETHPYDVPEFIVLQPESTSAAYANWIFGFCKSGSLPSNEAHEHIS